MKRSGQFAATVLFLGSLAVSKLEAQPLQLVADLSPGRSNSFLVSTRVISALGDKALLHVEYPGATALLATDGTASGTRLLASLCGTARGCGGFQPRLLGQTASYAFLDAIPVGSVAPGLVWRSDGTRLGTFVLTDAGGVPLAAPVATLAPTAVAGGALYLFSCAAGLDHCGVWRNDGSSSVSQLLVSMPPPSWPEQAVALGSKLFWTDDKYVYSTSLQQPGPTLVFGASGRVARLAAAGGRLWIVASAASEAGTQLWSSNGSPGGARVVTSFSAGAGVAGWQEIQAAGSRTYFVCQLAPKFPPLLAVNFPPSG